MPNPPAEADDLLKEPICFDAYESGEGPGAAFGFESNDLDVTVVSWPQHYSVPSHVNPEVDVATVVLSGVGKAVVAGQEFDLRLGSVLIVPKGLERSVMSLSVDFRYVNIHKRRRRLMPQIGKSRND